MARAITVGAKDWRRIGRVVQEVEGAPQQSSHRRGRWPIGAGGNRVQLVYITQDIDGMTGGDPAAFYSDIVGGTVPFTCNSKSDGTGKDYDVYWSQPMGVFFTGQRIWIAKRPRTDSTPGKWWEVAQAGQERWQRATAEGNIIGGTGQANLPFNRFYPTAAVDTIVVDIIWFDATFNVADESDIIVSFDQQVGAFYGEIAGCPAAGG
jgi:hypothetical protein